MSDAAVGKPACVLTFHRVLDAPERAHDISWAEFSWLLDGLEPSSIAADLTPNVLAQAPVVLTFDDGTADHVAVADALAERGVAAIFFVSTALLGAPGFISRADVSAIRRMGHIIGSHAAHHTLLSRLEPDELSRELSESRRALEELLAEPVTLFAPPGGVVSRAVLRAVPRHGYEACRLMRWGLYSSASERWTIPCVPVTSLTLDRGWVRECLRTRRLPPAMRAARMMKSVAPTRARTLVRTWIHRRYASVNGG
ncbi:MAG: polysaccharide deacetylase family protein [Actinomycetota bacterium]|nr:polysaccharide deacetylase family protein [Actinomycetota bacterium]